MSYLRCTACGAKALRAASQCPRCTTPFALTDARGRRVPLTPCRGCGYLHRVDMPCHWCGVLPPSAWRQGVTYRRAAGVVLALGLGVSLWRVGVPTFVSVREAAAPLADVVSMRTAPVRVGEASAAATRPGGVPQDSVPPAPALPAPLSGDAAPPPPVPGAGDQGSASTATGAVATAADSVRWVPAVARTWVNVRADASREGAVIGVISPSSRALLEAGRSGWRRVRASDVRGWVDPRLFVADTTGRRDG